MSSQKSKSKDPDKDEVSSDEGVGSDSRQSDLEQADSKKRHNELNNAKQRPDADGSNDSNIETDMEDEPPTLFKAGKQRIPLTDLESVMNALAESCKTLDRKTSYGDETTKLIMLGYNSVFWSTTNRELKKKMALHLLQNNFPEIVCKMMKFFQGRGLFYDDVSWFPCFYAFSNCWNYSDVSHEMARGMGEAGLIAVMFENLTGKPFKDKTHVTTNVNYVEKASLGALNNMSRQPELKHYFVEIDPKSRLQRFLEGTDDFLRANAMMVLSSILDESESSALDDSKSINFILGIVKGALIASNKRCRGFSVEETVDALARMAVFDKNKQRIAFNPITIPSFLRILGGNEIEDLKATCRCIWTLSFDKEVRKKFCADESMMTLLEKHTAHENMTISRAAKGAIWVMRDNLEKEESKRDESSGDWQPHVFISYNWAHQDLLIKLKDRLKSDGFRVWMDVDQMAGSTLEAMAEAVEKAAIVIMAISDKYKLSPNCRTEAEYVWQLKKPFIPILMQRKYKADGWLGMLIGTKLYVDFSKHDFDAAYKMTKKELSGRGRDTFSKNETSSSTGDVTDDPSAGKQRPRTAGTRTCKMETWKEPEVAAWIDKLQLGDKKKKFECYDGKMLLQLSKVMDEAPQYFYERVERNFSLNLQEVLRFSEALAAEVLK